MAKRSFPDTFWSFKHALRFVGKRAQYARRYYNGAVRDYAILAETFPSRLVAPLCPFRPRDYFEVESSSERQAPEVKLA